jgi:tetratricopeptide (TPR) repeat protein
MSQFPQIIWNELQNLTAQETDTLARFQQDLKGTLFVSVAEIFRKRGMLDEAIVILEDGLRKFPHYHSARASLAKDYFYKGLMPESNAQLELVLQKNPDNLMAQRLRLKLALLFRNDDVARARLETLKQLFPDDEFTRSVRDLINSNNWPGATALVTEELSRLGVRYDISNPDSRSTLREHSAHSHQNQPGNNGTHHDLSRVSSLNYENSTHTNTAGTDTNTAPWEVPEPWSVLTQSGAQDRVDDLKSTSLDSLPTHEEEIPEEETSLPNLRPSLSLAHLRGDPDKYLPLKGFRRVESKGLFASLWMDSVGASQHPSLESMTLAEIYVTQGMYLKACSIYERLLKENPFDAELRKLYTTTEKLASEHLRKMQPTIANTAMPPPPPPVPVVTPEVEARQKKLQVLEHLLKKLDDVESHNSRGKPVGK